MSRRDYRICEFCGAVNRVRGTVCPTCHAEGTLLNGDRPPIPVVRGGPPERDRLYHALVKRLQGLHPFRFWDWHIERAGRRSIHVTRLVRSVSPDVAYRGKLLMLLAIGLLWYSSGTVLGVLAAAFSYSIYATYKRIKATRGEWCTIMVSDDGRAIVLNPEALERLAVVRAIVEREGLRIEPYEPWCRDERREGEGAIAT